MTNCNSETPPAEPLTPARAELARLIALLDAAVTAAERARQPVDRLAAIKSRATALEAEELRHELDRLRQQDAAAIRAWLEGGAVGPRPNPSAKTLAAERRYAELTRAAKEAGSTLPVAEHTLDEALRQLKALTMERDCAVLAASVEAAKPVLTELERMIADACALEARLWSLIDALRQIGWTANDATAALSAAERIEKAVATVRRRRGDLGNRPDGRRLLEALKTDPAAAL